MCGCPATNGLSGLASEDRGMDQLSHIASSGLGCGGNPKSPRNREQLAHSSSPLVSWLRMRKMGETAVFRSFARAVFL